MLVTTIALRNFCFSRFCTFRQFDGCSRFNLSDRSPTKYSNNIYKLVLYFEILGIQEESHVTNKTIN